MKSRAAPGGRALPSKSTLLLACAVLVVSGGCLARRQPSRNLAGGVRSASSDGPRFADVAARSGLRYRWEAPSRRPLTVLDTIGNGCAFLDYDRDGCLDILLVGPRLALYRGDGKGHFTDVTAAVGLAGMSAHFLGCAVGDYDNDGYPDIYISGYMTGLLLHNVGGRRFEDVTRSAGIAPQTWGTSAAFADVDGDGKLDLYVGNYVRFTASSQQYCKTNGVETSCPPGIYDGIPGRLYRNEGNGRFADVSAAWGLRSSRGKTLGVAFGDFDQSGRQSLALANDEVPGELYLNRGGTFTDIGSEAGVAYSNVGQPQAGMGEDWGDYDGDGRLDLTVMTFSTELKPIYHNEGHRFFTDCAAQLGTASVEIPYVAFGVKWIDVDNDGWLDLLITNGHTADNIADTGQGLTYRQPTLLLKNQGGMRFVRISQLDIDRPIVGRGLAIGDYDNDGRMDTLIVDNEGSPILLHNETPPSGHWLTLRLIGRNGNRDGYGAEITVETGKRKLFRHCHADGSYLSSSDPRVHFGLGDETVARTVTIRWPGGRIQTLKAVRADRILSVEEGEAPK